MKLSSVLKVTGKKKEIIVEYSKNKFEHFQIDYDNYITDRIVPEKYLNKNVSWISVNDDGILEIGIYKNF